MQTDSAGVGLAFRFALNFEEFDGGFEVIEPVAGGVFFDGDADGLEDVAGGEPDDVVLGVGVLLGVDLDGPGGVEALEFGVDDFAVRGSYLAHIGYGSGEARRVPGQKILAPYTHV